MHSRRSVLAGAAGLALSGCMSSPPAATAAAARIAALEERLGGGRLGVCAINLGTGARIEHRSAERFAMASTFKWLLAACVLDAAEQGRFSLRTPISLEGVEILSVSPVTGAAKASGSIRIGELCAAICQVSDNTGANLLLDRIGGPEGLTAFLRRHGDPDTRLDRREPELNQNLPGDPRDTTTPAAMTASARLFLAGDALPPDWRNILTGWMEGATTGLGMLRKTLPPGWRAADKTGRGGNGAVNDVAIVWPPSSGSGAAQPILIASYSSEGAADTATREAIHAEVGRILFEAWA
jgi:beta-lactamase class A